MADLRTDPLGRRQVIVAPGRAKRGAPPFMPDKPDPEPCDFCGGKEGNTPPETYAVREPGTKPDEPGWRVRVVPNLYPATPFHEVVVHTPEHRVKYEELPAPHQVEVVQTYQARVKAAPTAATLCVWNRGISAGASRSHGHGQIFGLERIPPTLERELVAFMEEPCVLCKLASDGALLVEKTGDVKVIAHPVPYVAGELLIVPPCTPRFETVDDVADVARAFAVAIERAVGHYGEGLPFNLAIHSAPTGIDDGFHWHAHLMPRTAVWGGLEMGAELPIVAADPYATAASLRG